MASDGKPGAGETAESRQERSRNLEPAHAATLSVKILKLIKEAQQQHGLRHGDYQRYRSYCTRRLRRLRKTLHFLQGDRKHYKKKEVSEELLKDERFLYLPLVLSERAWSYGMQLKQEANTEPRKKFHLIGRLRKATIYADQLERLCESAKCDARTKLEGQAYGSWIRGSLQFELHLWKAAMESLQKAQMIYEKLAVVVNEDEQLLYRQRVEELAPSLRYCAYNIGDESARQDLLKMRGQQGSGSDIFANLDALIAQTREKQAATLSEVTWRGRTVPVTDEKVRTFLLAVQEFDNELARATDHAARMSLYEALLLESKDAIQALRDEVKGDPSLKNRPVGSDGPLPTKQYLLAYLTFIRLSKTIERNLLMVENLSKALPGHTSSGGSGSKKPPRPQDIIRLYDIIIHNLNELQQLPSLEEDMDFQQSFELQTVAYKAFRCFYIATIFINEQRWPESVALLQRADEYAQKALKGKLDSLLREQLKKLQLDIEGQRFSAHAHSILSIEDTTVQVTKVSAKNKPLAERIDQYYEDPSLTSPQPNVITFPPDFQPIPCKPLFFDLALNHIQFPSLDDELEQKQVGGLTGFVKGLWGWGGGK